jgi:hypothetical protein
MFMKAFLCATAILIICAAFNVNPVPAQDKSAARTASSSSQNDDTQAVDEESADLSITGSVTARELRFDEVPNPTVEFTGKPERRTEWSAVRENLPRPVQPGVTYRDIGIRLRIVSVFADIDRIVAEALGEVPTTDAVPNENSSGQPPATNTTTTTTAPASQAPRQTTGQTGERKPQ